MKHVDTFRLAVLVWLSLAGILSSQVTAATPAQTDKSVEVTSLKQLQTILSSSSFRSDEVKDLNITANGILVDQTVAVNPGTYRMHGGPLIRAEGFTGSILDILEGANLTIENTIDGANIQANNEALITIKTGGLMTLSQGSYLKNAFVKLDTKTTIIPNFPPPAIKPLLTPFVVANQGTFILDGGTITGNKGEHPLITNYANSTFSFKSGTITDNSSSFSVYNIGTFNLYPYTASINFSEKIYLQKPIHIFSPLNKSLSFTVELKEGTIVAQGGGNYSLSETDLKNLSVFEIEKSDLILKLQNNQIVLTSSSTPGGSEITTPEELQKAIDEATGTADDPTVITIPKEGLKLTSKIIINGKYIKLTGGTIWNAVAKVTRMFEIKSGKLILENIILDGYGYPTQAPQYCTFVFIEGGEFILSKGAILQNAKCHWDLLNAVVVKGGHFYMEDGMITKNTCELGGLIYVYGKGGFTMKGGHIYDNTVGKWGSVFISSNFWYYAGNITHNNNEDCLYVQGNFIVYGGNQNDMIDAIKIVKGGKILLASKLNISLRITELMGDFTEGEVIMQGTEGYTLTTQDLEKITLAKDINWILKLIDNTIILTKPSSEGISTPEELQKAIDEAPVGSLEKPTLITIPQAGIDFTRTVTIQGKHIRITANGGSFRNITTDDILFFDIQSGSLTLENTVLLGTVKGTNRYCSFAKVAQKAFLFMTDVTMQKALSEEKTWSMLRIYGNCTLKNCTITENTGAALIYIAAQGNCTIEGGKIQNNICSDSHYTHGLIYNFGELDYVSGVFTQNHAISLYSWGTSVLRNVQIKNYLSYLIKDEGSSIFVYQNIHLRPGQNIQDSFYLEDDGKGKQGYISIFEKITASIELVIHQPQEGWTVAKGIDYTLTSSDLEKFKLASSSAKGWALKLINNTIVLTSTSSSGIDTQEKLQAAIDASNGTASAPATITIANKEIPIYSSILIKNKYVKLTGGTLKNAASADLRMFDIRSGYLGLTHITLDGNQKQAHGYCTLIEMNGGNCEILEGTKLTQALARGGREAVVVVPQGKLTFKEGEISGNTSEGGDIVWVSGSGNFTMQGGSIKGNTNSGRYIMAGIQMTNGAMALNGGQITDNSGSRYGVYATKPFTLAGGANLKEVIILNGESKLLIPSALKNTVIIGFMKSNMPSGTVVASGSNYTLTEADAKKFTYRYANTYGFQLQNNQIVLVNLDAQNKTFTLKTTPSKGGTVTLSKSTAKENELITVTAKPEKGKKLYADGLRYNNNKMTPTSQPDIYTFKMPPANVTVTADFIPELITVKPDTTDLGPADTNPIPEISDMEGLIEGFGGNGDIDPSQPTDLIPTPKTLGKDNLPEPLSGQVKQGENGGDDVIGSLEQLISIVTKTTDGTPLKTKVIKRLASKTTLRIYLPDRLIVSEQLRASGTANYYILNQCEDQVTRIVPTFDAEANTLTFDTDKLGTFVVMNARSTIANEQLSADEPRVSVVDGEIQIEHLAAGDYYAIYDLSGKLLKKERSNGHTVRYLPKVNGTYIVQYPSGTRKIYFSK